ncbi:hypothetical protein [Micromonospora sp. ATA51]|uniref:hypothetical protein n=1 Tax=Micromonospora sp. ATA51 TaxID=2806098 RepID=UPI001A58BB5A|nr:hypothetical protein [Micromonospora sp. ATA51]MBM0229006.1 hypothetical protein [Micromonospora sp. ATA51]
MRFTGIRWNRRTAGIGAAIVATAVAGTASLAATAGFGEDGAVWGEGDGPVSTALHTVAFPAANGREVTIPKRDTERFAMVGVTWANPNVDFKGTVAVRTHAVDGDWSDWRPLELDNHFGPEPGAEATAGKARGGTDPGTAVQPRPVVAQQHRHRRRRAVAAHLVHQHRQGRDDHRRAAVVLDVPRLECSAGTLGADQRA